MTHAVHRLNGIVTPASAAYSAPELEHQLRSSNANALFTCVPLLETALTAAKAVGIPEDRIFLLPVPGAEAKPPFKTIDDLIAEGNDAPELKPLNWIKGQGERQVAYLCYSSGTSGLPVSQSEISSMNTDSQFVESRSNQSSQRHRKRYANGSPRPRRPQGSRCRYPSPAWSLTSQPYLRFSPSCSLRYISSHLVFISYLTNSIEGIYNGDETVILPRFELKSLLSSVQRFKIQQMALVPPIFIQMLSNQAECAKYDLSTVRFIFSGAAPLGQETIAHLNQVWPSWRICQGYGMSSPHSCKSHD